ncbi:hypothetical protein EDB84DRAFT_1676087 [Lactarius hengduanensis]|nr:hypothetical protein EDB84DRAFT_1676087 [Lactarius hengduanensis]
MATMLNAWLNDSLGHPADLIHLGVHPNDDDDTHDDDTHDDDTHDDDTHDDDTHDSYPPPTQTWQATTATTKTQQQRQHDCDCDNGGNATTFFVLHGDRGYNPRYRPMVVRYTTVFVYRGVESYTAGLTHGYGCGVGAGAVSRVAGTVPGNDTRGATRVVPYSCHLDPPAPHLNLHWRHLDTAPTTTSTPASTLASLPPTSGGYGDGDAEAMATVARRLLRW